MIAAKEAPKPMISKIKTISLCTVSLLLSACGGSAKLPPRAASKPYIAPAQSKLNPAGLERVLGADAAGLINQFGEPRLDVVEPYGRKLQFAGDPCVLDAYLYPDKNGDGRVTHIDARNRDGAAVDRAACAQALQAR